MTLKSEHIRKKCIRALNALRLSKVRAALSGIVDYRNVDNIISKDYGEFIDKNRVSSNFETIQEVLSNNEKIVDVSLDENGDIDLIIHTNRFS